MRGRILRFSETSLVLAAVLTFTVSSCSSAKESDEPEAEAEPACTVNADCADSAAVAEAAMLKCPEAEVFCDGGQCAAECALECVVSRLDVNPCESGTCSLGPFGRTYCSMLPVECESEEACPAFLPDGETAWTCDEGVCKHPSWEYPTQ